MRKVLNLIGNFLLLIFAFIIFVSSMSLGGILIELFGNEWLKYWVIETANGLAVFALVVTVTLSYIIKKILGI